MAQNPGFDAALDDADFVETLRRQMVRFAALQLSDDHQAEDAVQEALLAAFRNAGAFAGRAAYKTWVFAILRNKIADILRRRLRSPEAPAPTIDEEADLSELFDESGHWNADDRPSDWGNPQESLHQAQFWRVFEMCLDGLPGSQARVFMMREYVELDSREICATAGITVGNLNVLLYRARLRLRECLENRWFAEGALP